MFGERFLLKLKGSVYKIYVRPAFVYGSEASGLKEATIAVFLMPKKSTVTEMYRVQRMYKNSKGPHFLGILLDLKHLLPSRYLLCVCCLSC